MPRQTSEFPRAITNGIRDGCGVELVGSRGHGKAGFANCGTRTPGTNSQQNGVTVGRDRQTKSRPNMPRNTVLMGRAALAVKPNQIQRPQPDHIRCVAGRRHDQRAAGDAGVGRLAGDDWNRGCSGATGD